MAAYINMHSQRAKGKKKTQQNEKQKNNTEATLCSQIPE